MRKSVRPGRTRLERASAALLGGVLSCTVVTPQLFAAESGVSMVEEVIVTAQRREESVQDVPIAVSAFSGAMLEDKQIIAPTDLQMNSPNVSFTATNFGSSSFSIRGIGRLVTAGSGDAGVSIHMNDVAMPTNLPASEFYDMERVEVLRGPQGTLYGRNATGGVVNMITAKPEFDEFKGYLDAELGDYAHRRLKGAVNIPVTDTFALRAAGMMLERDGYTENLAAEQGVAGVDDDLDGRDLYSFRITGRWDITDRARAWALYTRFDEDDDRARITNQVCEQNELPTVGCTPDGFGFEGVHPGSTTGGMFAAFAGASPIGAADAGDGLTFPFPRPDNLGLRTQHTDFEPTYEFEEDVVTGGFTYDFDDYSVELLGGYRESEYLSRQDYNMDVGHALAPTVQFDPDAFFAGQDPLGAGPGIVQVTDYPTSDVSGGVFAPGCNLFAGNAGTEGGPGCVLDNAPTDRVFSYDQSNSEDEYWTFEAKIRSDFDGPFNFLLGGNYTQSESSGDYFVVGNSLDIVTQYGSPFFGFPPLYPGYFDSHSSGPGYEFESRSVFGEAYYDITEKMKLTVGLRYNEDEKQVRDAGYLYNSIDMATTCFGSGLGGDCSALAGLGLTPLTEKTFVRTPFVSSQYVFGAPLTGEAADLVDFYGLGDQAAAAVTLDDRLAVAQGVPLAPTTGEARALTGSPDEDTFDAVTGRIGIDWQISDTTMLYGFFSRGYKPGGFNPPVNPSFQSSTPFTFEKEEVDAFEIGAKNVLMDGQMILNATAFVYDYSGLQIAKIQNNTAVNDNVDADIMGAELEMSWQPEAVPQLAVDMAYSWLKTEVASGTRLLDTVDRTQGDPDLVQLKNIDSGSNTGVNFVAPRADVAAISAQAIADGAAVGPAAAPAAQYPDGIPAYFSRNYLTANGVAASDGVLTDIGGNQLPNSPEHTVHLGVAYSFQVADWASLTPRWDYYWQDDSYAREYNRPGDEIEAWDQHNVSLILETNDGRWMARAWVRNLQDEDNVTGHYVTSDTSGMFRNYFLTEPRIYGASVRMNF